MMELIVKLNGGNCAFINVYWLKTVKKIKRFGSSEFFFCFKMWESAL